MAVKSLIIERRPGYDIDYPNQLVGLVKLESAHGSQEIKLTNESLSEIFRVITAQVVGTAKTNANEVAAGMSEVQYEPLLADSQKLGAIE